MNSRVLVLSCVAVLLCGPGFSAVALGQNADRDSNSWRTPRTADGQPDLQGVWQALNTASWNIQDHAAREGVPAGQGVVVGNEIPYQPWAAAKSAKHSLANSTFPSSSMRKTVWRPEVADWSER